MTQSIRGRAKIFQAIRDRAGAWPDELPRRRSVALAVGGGSRLRELPFRSAIAAEILRDRGALDRHVEQPVGAARLRGRRGRRGRTAGRRSAPGGEIPRDVVAEEYEHRGDRRQEERQHAERTSLAPSRGRRGRRRILRIVVAERAIPLGQHDRPVSRRLARRGLRWGWGCGCWYGCGGAGRDAVLRA